MTVQGQDLVSGRASKAHSGKAFGLYFRGDRPLPELSASAYETTADSIVELDWGRGTAASGALDSVQEGVIRFVDGTFGLHVPGIASYEVTTHRIAIAAEPGADDRSVRAFLFGSAIGALLQMRGLLVLHGSAIAMPDGGAAVFCGHSTAGKSTLAAALAARGHPAMADDLTAIRFDSEGAAWCLPGLARTKLWRDALDTLGLASRASAATRVMPEMDKHSLHLTTSARPARLRHFYELHVDDGPELTFRAATGVDKLGLLITHAYRPAYLLAMGRQATLLRHAAALAPHLRANRIVRPRGEKTLDAIVAWLEQQWASPSGTQA